MNNTNLMSAVNLIEHVKLLEERLDSIVINARAAGWNIYRAEDLGAAMQAKIDLLEAPLKAWNKNFLLKEAGEDGNCSAWAPKCEGCNGTGSYSIHSCMLCNGTGEKT